MSIADIKPTPEQIAAFHQAYDDSIEMQPREAGQAIYEGLCAAIAAQPEAGTPAPETHLVGYTDRIADAIYDAMSVSDDVERSVAERYARAAIAAMTPEPQDHLMGTKSKWPHLIQLGRTLGFFASVIKSGEPWTATCQSEYDLANVAMKEAYADLNSRVVEPPEPHLVVKPLEWKAANEGFGHGRTHYGMGVFGHWYGVSRKGAGVWTCVHHVGGTPEQLPAQTSLENAKAAAQADYECTILAFLTAPPQTNLLGIEPVAWQPKYKPEFVEYLRRIRGDMNEPQVFFPTKKEAEGYGYGGHDARPLYDIPAVSGDIHPDDLAVDRFAAAMKVKLAKKRTEGRGGWDNPDECSIAFLSELLRSHIAKGDPVDVGNLAMMIHQRGGAIE